MTSPAVKMSSPAATRAGNATDRLRADKTAFLGNRIEADFQRLDARYPIALFPVRVETRFDHQNSALLVRVYPDEILADAHDTSLTAEEQAMGARFWSESATIGAQSAWQHLLGTYRAPRAAWIVRATDPGAIAPPTVRVNSWPRPVEAPLLPDRWIAVAELNGVEVGRAVSTPVLEPLALTLDVTAPTNQNVDISDGLGLTLDPAVAWTVKYDLAVSAGMAFSMQLKAEALSGGIDRLLVFGVKSTIGPDGGATAIASLFDAHHYSRGWAFVPQGTPTNDSREIPSGYPPADPNGTVSFGVERSASLATVDGDGVAWARAFGLTADAVAHVAGADRTEQRSAAAMNRALFPATWGYYLDTMLAPAVSASTVSALREYLVDRVRARGPFPAFRVGGVPYGVLPASTLSGWTSSGDGIETRLAPLLRAWRVIWDSNISAAPHIGRSTDSDADLVDVLSMDASARAIRLRRVLGQEVQVNLLAMLGIDGASWADLDRAIAVAVLAAAGLPNLDARVLSAVFADTAQRFAHGFVTETPVSESQGLNPNYITWIRNASLADLQREAFPSKPVSLLYRLLRYAALQEPWREARSILLATGLATTEDVREHELVGIVQGTEQRPTVWQHLDLAVPSVTRSLTLGQYLSPIRAGEPARVLPPSVIAYRDALGVLEPLPTAELERLATETLDLAASRLDAWMTSLYSGRLDAMRAAQPTGAHVGAFAWIEDLRPDPAPTERLPGGEAVRVSTGGFIHAPSMTHAAAAAVLRNGYLTHAASTPGTDTPYAVNLTSARVRAARTVLESVQQGQSIGAVFGYQVERGLHEQLSEVLIDPLRALYPITANKAFDSGEPAEMVAARNVVDGLRLRTAWRAGTIPWGASGIPSAGSSRTALETVLRALDDSVDAVADLLLAESVFQLVRGSSAGASASLDSVAQGVRPPDPGIAHPLRGGTDLTHRVAILIGGNAAALPAGWPAATTPRSAAEPRLDAWAGSMLGDPSNVTCRVGYPDPTIADPSNVTEVTVTLDQLGIRPLDFLALAAVNADGRQASELDRRIVFAARGDTAAAAGPATVNYDRDAAWDRNAVRTVPELLETARAINNVIGGARPLAPEDLVRPGDAFAAIGTGLAAGEIESRAADAEAALATVIANLDAAVTAVPAGATPTASQLAALLSSLRAAAQFGARGAYPVPGAGLEVGGIDPGVIAQAASVLAELTARQQQAAAAHLPAAPPPTDAVRVAATDARLRVVFGRDFLSIPGCVPPPGATMTAALAASATIVGDSKAPVRWLQQASRVRQPLARWRYMRLLSEACGAADLDLDVVQLPVAPGARWAALPFASQADRVPSRLSLVLHRFCSPAATDVWYGLALDEWVELIPNDIESTGVAFRYDDPGAEAAQAVLLAVPPSATAQQWDLQTLMNILNDTLDLAKARAVDSRLLGSLSQLLPAIYLAANENSDTIATHWIDALREEAKLFSLSGKLLT